jgi:hypothetical protein
MPEVLCWIIAAFENVLAWLLFLLKRVLKHFLMPMVKLAPKWLLH